DGGYNMGTTQAVHGLNDRALGAYAADSSPRSVSLMIVNDTAEALDAFFVQFDVERWMTTDTSKAGRARLVLEQGQTETTLVDFVTIAGVSQPFWNDAGFGEDGYGWVDGNAGINSVRELGGMVDLAALGAVIGIDEVFTLRWDLVEEGNVEAKATGLAVDNILVGVPEPGTLGILLVGAVGLLGRVRKR
ncbi:MAG: PEP-CTERM sorting domain-containing protein, partial [Phycisphaerae bacterium]